MFVKKPSDPEFKGSDDFLIKYGKVKKPKSKKKIFQERLEQSQNAWAALFGGIPQQ